MSSHADAHASDGHAADAHGGHHEVNYVRVWAILLALLVVSVVGPMFGIRVLTLITAFGIAIVKAYLVAKNFMHLNVERRFVVYLMAAMLGLMLQFFWGTSPDVMHHYGKNWENRAALDLPHTPGSTHDAHADAGAGEAGATPAHGAAAEPAAGHGEAAPAAGH